MSAIPNDPSDLSHVAQSPYRTRVENLGIYHRTKGERDRDLPVVASYYVMGWSALKISEVMNKLFYPERGQICTTNMMRRDITRAIKIWQKSVITDAGQRVAIELTKLDHLEATYWDGWERSKLDAVTLLSESGVGAHGVMDKSRTVTVGQAGDPRFLDGINRVIDQRCRLMGLNKPIEQPDESERRAALSDEERMRRILEILDRARSRGAVDVQSRDPSSIQAGSMSVENGLVDGR